MTGPRLIQQPVDALDLSLAPDEHEKSLRPGGGRRAEAVLGDTPGAPEPVRDVHARAQREVSDPTDLGDFGSLVNAAIALRVLGQSGGAPHGMGQTDRAKVPK